MGLTGALQIGRSGLLASQTAIGVVGNNLANATTRGYHRQVVSLAPVAGQEIQSGIFVGRGVQLEAITRRIDEALEGRLRGAVADQSRSLVRQDLLAQIEAIEGEFSDTGLSSRLTAFFNAWSNLANNPQDPSLRALVVQEAEALSGFIRDLRESLVTLRTQVDTAADDAAATVNNLLGQIEDLNNRIAVQEHGSGGASALRDQRDAALSELARYLDISTVESPSGVVDVYVGSLPIVLNGQSRGVELKKATVDGELEAQLVVAADGSPLDISSGQLGAMVQFRQEDLAQAIGDLDTFAAQLIWQVNRIHSQSQGLQSFQSITGATKVADADAALNDEAAGLDLPPAHGSFQIHVTQLSTGQRLTYTINVDLDGINPAGDTTLTSLAADLDAISDITASVSADGRLQISADTNDFRISFSDDTSGVLASLGINTFFTGTSARDIGVNSVVAQDVNLLAAGRGHAVGDNQAALAIAGLRQTGVDELGGMSLPEYWSRHVEDLAAKLSATRQQVDADTVVLENLQAQQQAISGVNIDEEAIDLVRYQQAYQASARFLSVVDELMRTLLAMV